MKPFFEFSCDFPHPDNPTIRIRFIIEMPAFSVEHLPDGAVLENYIRWRSDDRD